MNIESIIQDAIAFSQANPVVFFIGAAVILLFLLRKSKGFIGVLLLAAILAGIFYLVFSGGMDSSRAKNRLIKKSGQMPGKQ